MTMERADFDDLMNLVCGKLLGEGQYRQVFACHLDESWVVKKDTGENYSNIHEYAIYDEAYNTPLRKWLAPARWLSPRGLWLIQDRTEPISKDRLPKSVPSIFCDFKADNWGLLNGRPVCHDYGNHALYVLMRKHAMKRQKANWK